MQLTIIRKGAYLIVVDDQGRQIMGQKDLVIESRPCELPEVRVTFILDQDKGVRFSPTLAANRCFGSKYANRDIQPEPVRITTGAISTNGVADLATTVGAILSNDIQPEPVPADTGKPSAHEVMQKMVAEEMSRMSRRPIRG